jgi:hypothetical protein
MFVVFVCEVDEEIIWQELSLSCLPEGHFQLRFALFVLVEVVD